MTGVIAGQGADCTMAARGYEPTVHPQRRPQNVTFRDSGRISNRNMHSSVSKPVPPINKFPAISDGRDDLCISYLRLYSTTDNLRLTIRSAPNQRPQGGLWTDVSGVRIAPYLDDGYSGL